MPLISVFTPSHDTRWLDECYASLVAQTYKDWEWIVYLNKGAIWPKHLPQPKPDFLGAFGNFELPEFDIRIKVVRVFLGEGMDSIPVPEAKGVGEAKKIAVESCSGEILVELDHDDILRPTALAEVVDAFDKNPDAGMVYSQCAAIDENGNSSFNPYMPGIGWRYKKTVIDGRDFTYPITMEPTPHNLAHIWYAPNHLRAFSRVAYDKAGGYNIELDVLDDQDLMGRLYLVGEFVKIDKCLYLQRNHSERTSAGPIDAPQTDTNARIQVETIEMYDRTIEKLALAWATREKLYALDLGGLHGAAPGYLTVDQHPGADIQHKFPWKLSLPESSVGVIRAYDFLEHVQDKVAMMNEIYRLLAPGGYLLSMTPSTDGRGAFQDPTHVAFWNSNSFWYYTDPNLARFVPEITARFQVSRIFDQYPSPWHEQHKIGYVYANLIAIKEGMSRNGGVIKW